MSRNALFLSIDICGSTSFKHSRRYWIESIVKITKTLTDHFENQNFKVWKFLGDEILFYKTFNSESLERDVLEVIDFKDNFNDTSFLKIKCTLWSANFDDEGLLNRIFSPKNQIDFLGRHIDFGFRLTKFAQPETVIIDPFIASELKGSKKVYPDFKGKKKLKGVDNRCPIYSIEKGEGVFVDHTTNFLKKLDSEEKTERDTIFSSPQDSLSLVPPILASLTTLERISYNPGMFETHGLNIEEVVNLLRTFHFPKDRKSGREFYPLTYGDVTLVLGVDLTYKSATVVAVKRTNNIFV